MPPVVMKEAAKPLENDPVPRRPDRALPVPASIAAGPAEHFSTLASKLIKSGEYREEQ
jgi:hypothetical protein